LLLKQDEFGSNCAVDKHSKISVEVRVSVDIQKVKYRWTDLSVGLYSVPLYLVVDNYLAAKEEVGQHKEEAPLDICLCFPFNQHM